MSGGSIRSLTERIVKVSSVTGAEGRAISNVLNELLQGLSLVPKQHRNRVSVDFRSDSQVLVRWNGAPSSKRQTILVTHTDKEGMLVRGVKPIQNGSLLEVSTPNGSSLERRFERAQFRIEAGIIAPALVGTGVACCVDEEFGILVESKVGDECSAVLASGAVLTARWDPPAVASQGRESTCTGWSLDNALGVTVGLRTLLAAATEGLGCNLGLLLTGGEECGFVGILAFLQSELQRNAPWEDLAWIVVDCSSRDHASIMDFESLAQLRVSARAKRRLPDPIDYGRSLIDARSCIVRVEDKLSWFDLQFAGVLVRAATQSRMEFIQGPSEAQETAKKAASPWHRSELFTDPALAGAVDYPMLGKCAAMYGGFCEGSILAHRSQISDAIGSSVRALSNLGRLGVIGLPIGNYRNIPKQDRDGVEHLLPEEADMSVVVTATLLCLNAARIHHYWSYAPFRDEGGRGFLPGQRSDGLSFDYLWRDHWSPRLTDAWSVEYLHSIKVQLQELLEDHAAVSELAKLGVRIQTTN